MTGGVNGGINLPSKGRTFVFFIKVVKRLRSNELQSSVEGNGARAWMSSQGSPLKL